MNALSSVVLWIESLLRIAQVLVLYGQQRVLLPGY